MGGLIDIFEKVFDLWKFYYSSSKDELLKFHSFSYEKVQSGILFFANKFIRRQATAKSISLFTRFQKTNRISSKIFGVILNAIMIVGVILYDRLNITKN
jgi:hypothetical protein